MRAHLETLYVDGTILTWTSKDALRVAQIVQLLDMGLSLTEATGGEILQQDLTGLRMVQQFKLQRANIGRSMQSVGGTGENFTRVA